ncbi:MAG: putative Na+/H+ antiporter [Verrucomicrobiota bacterium]
MFTKLLAGTLVFLAAMSCLHAAGIEQPSYPQLADGTTQYAVFPRPAETYAPVAGGAWEIIKSRAVAEPFNVVATVIFILAICHTFLAAKFTKWSHRVEHEHEQRVNARRKADEHPDAGPVVSLKATMLHFLGEVEAIFGIWVLALGAAAVAFFGWDEWKLYLGRDRNFTEPMFVVIIMAIAASRPVLRFTEQVISKAAALGKGSPAAWWLSVLTIAPVLGSFITEPAAMTIGALLLAKKFYRCRPSPRLAYATLGLLFVNVSVGGTFTHFAAPPVLMVAGKWGWDTLFMIEHFGWKSLVGLLVSNAVYFAVFRKELRAISDRADGLVDGRSETPAWEERETPIPAWITVTHLMALAWTVFTAHDPVLFVWGFLFFLAFTVGTEHHQNPIQLKSPLLVGFFLAGLVIHGGCQGWWIAPVITSLGDQALMFGATVLTAFNDNAAITYLASQVQGISLSAKHAVVAGAVTGGGLTVIANAPNPAGQNILARFFKNGISPLGLFLGAVVPTAIVYFCFVVLPNGGNTP